MAGEFTYLMLSGAHPAPPRDSAAESEDVGLGQAQSRDYSLAERQRIEDQYIPKQQQMDLARLMQEDDRQAALERERNAVIQRQRDVPQAAMMQREQPQRQSQAPPNYWTESQKPQATQMQQPQEEEVSQVNHVFDSFGRELNSEEVEVRKEGVQETDSGDWDFGDVESKPLPVGGTSRGDTDAFPSAQVEMPGPKSPGNRQRRRSSAGRRGESEAAEKKREKEKEGGQFKVRFGLRGHLDVVRAIVFTGGGSPGEPELATAGDDGVIKRWIIPSRYSMPGSADGQQAQRDDMDIPPSFTHRGHSGAVLCLTAWHPSIHQSFAPGAPRAQGEGWVFSGGQDASIRVWERARVDPKATLEGHTDAVWAVCVLPTTCGQIFGQNSSFGGPERILLVSGAADGMVKVWSVSAPPSLPNPTGSAGRRGGRQRGNSTSSGSGFSGAPQPSLASHTPFSYTLIHSLTREGSNASPTSIVPLGPGGESFVVSYNDAAVLVFDTRTGEELSSMASTETYDGTIKTAVNAIVATTSGLDSSLTFDAGRGGVEDIDAISGATGSSRGVEGTIITGHEDCFIRFFDANSGKLSPSPSPFTTPIHGPRSGLSISPPSASPSPLPSTTPSSSANSYGTGQCTYNMLAHPSSISSLSLSPDGRELVSAGHDASLRFWSLEKRSCVMEVQGARVMRGEGCVGVEWSADGRTVVGGGGDGVVKVFCR